MSLIGGHTKRLRQLRRFICKFQKADLFSRIRRLNGIPLYYFPT